MDNISDYGEHEALGRMASSIDSVSPRVVSITTDSSSNSGSTAGTSPLLCTNRLPDYSRTYTPKMQPDMQDDQNAFASTSTQPTSYYPMPAAGYMSFRAPFSNSSPPPPPTAAAGFSQSPSPVPIPNPSTTMPVPMPMPVPDLTPPVPVVDNVHDSGVDFGPGIRPSSRAASTAVVAAEPFQEAPLFRARSLLGFARTQSRLGFVKPRPLTLSSIPSEEDLDLDSDSELNLVQPHHHTYDESTRALLEDLRPVVESCIEILVRLIPTPQVSSTGRLVRLPVGREEAVCLSMEGTLRHLWGCITLQPGCACPSEQEQEFLPEGGRGSDVCREFHEAFERKLRRLATRIRTFHEQIDRPRRMHSSSFTVKLLGWQDAFDQWINRFERLYAYLRIRLAHAHAKEIGIQIEHERAIAAQIRSSENSDAGSISGRRSSQRHLHHHALTIQQLKEDYEVAKSALLEEHKRAAGLARRRDAIGQLVSDFGTWTIRDAV